MRTVFDELEGLLGADQVAKIKANAGLNHRLTKTDEIMSLYDDETDDAPPRRTESRTDDRDDNRDDKGGDQSLADLTKTLQDITAKLGDVPTKAELEETLKKKGDELFNNVLARSLAQMDELGEIKERHREEFGTRLDSAAFKNWINDESKPVDQGGKGRRFESITDAYERYTADKRQEVLVETKVREKLKERAKDNQGNYLPGVTPPSSKSPISTFMKRGREADGSGSTAIDRAGAALEARINAQASEA